MVEVLVAAVALVAGTWTLHRPRTLAAGVGGSASSPTVSVVVPARDEAAHIGTLLRALAASRRVPTEVIVVDDGSVDGTASVAEGFESVVVSAPPLPPGWTGKNWACHLGAQRARGDVLLFLDADTCLSPGALDALIVELDRHGGLVSVQPHHRVRRLYERLSAAFNLVAVMGSGAFGVRPRTPARVAFGPCLVIAAADYRSAGGHAGVRADVVEDIALAARCREHGLAVTCMLGGHEISFRMYPDGVRQLAEGWTKNIATGAARGPLSAVVPAVIWVMAVAATAVTLLVGLAGWWSGGSAPLLAASAWLVTTIQIRTKLRHVGTFGWGTALLFTIPLLFFVGVFIRSSALAILHRPVRWRGRRIALSSGGVD
ncbi:MAG: hypothetical protein JWN62_4731 [Acidimicrobiales bacterium]|nr:hypothetical protein [Acidimicrobiales bacterium]